MNLSFFLTTFLVLGSLQTYCIPQSPLEEATNRESTHSRDVHPTQSPSIPAKLVKASIVPVSILTSVFLSTASHELGHAIIGSLCGGKVSTIKFSLLGATTYFSRPPSTAVELTDIAGPLAGIAGALVARKILQKAYSSQPIAKFLEKNYDPTELKTDIDLSIGCGTFAAIFNNTLNILPWTIKRQNLNRYIISDGAYFVMSLAKRFGISWTPPDMTDYLF